MNFNKENLQKTSLKHISCDNVLVQNRIKTGVKYSLLIRNGCIPRVILQHSRNKVAAIIMTIWLHLQDNNESYLQRVSRSQIVGTETPLQRLSITKSISNTVDQIWEGIFLVRYESVIPQSMSTALLIIAEKIICS